MNIDALYALTMLVQWWELCCAILLAAFAVAAVSDLVSGIPTYAGSAGPRMQGKTSGASRLTHPVFDHEVGQ